MDKYLLSRIGTFFILVGCGLVILLGGSIITGEYSQSILYLIFVAVTLFLGSVLRRTAPRPEPTRFSSIRNARQRSRQRREDKQAQKEQEK
jgi:hypothetical protein